MVRHLLADGNLKNLDIMGKILPVFLVSFFALASF